MAHNFCPNCALPLHGLENNLFCPGCHQDLGRQPVNALALRGSGASGWQPVAFDGGGTWRRYSTLESSVPLALPAPSDGGGSVTASRRSPARSPEFGADVFVVAGQAALIGLAGSILAFPLPWIIWGDFGGVWVSLPWWTFGPVGLWTFAGAILKLIQSNRAHLWSEETVTQDAAPVEPAPAPAGEVGLIISHTNSSGKFIGGLNLTLPKGIPQDKFYEFARGATRRGASLAVVDWTGQGKLFSKPKYNSLLTVLGEAGIVSWIDEENHSVGRRLTDEGRVALVGFCEGYEK